MDNSGRWDSRLRIALWSLALLTAAAMEFLSCSTTPSGIVEPIPILSSTLDESPSWSPDGDSIAYYHQDETGDTTSPTGLYVVNVATRHSRLVLRGSTITPRWSPDGRLIAFGPSGLVTCTLDGSRLNTLTDITSYYPSWSPDMRRIAFDTLDLSYTFEICAVDSDGANLVALSADDSGGWRSPDWSPDGRRIVHSGWPRGAASQDIYV